MKFINDESIDHEHADVNSILTDTITFDIVCIMIFVGLVINFFILVFSIIKLINFLNNNIMVKTIWYLVIVPLTIVYVNNVFTMIAFNWGLPAHNIISELNISGQLNQFQSIQNNEVFVKFFKTSFWLNLYTPLIWSMLF